MISHCRQDRLQSGFASVMRCLALLLAVLFVTPASALEAISVSRDQVALDLSRALDVYRAQGASFQVSTAPGPDGIVRRIEVQAADEETSGDWAVFALANTSDTQIDRLIVAPHYRLAGSGLIWPDLGSNRIASITPSEGFALDRQDDPESDVFLVTINPGSIVTFVVELAASDIPQLYLWDVEAYKDTVNSYTLYRGIVLGIAGLLALFLTILFVVKGTAMFPATASLAWAVLVYVAIDFGFMSKVIAIAPGSEQVWRASSEVMIAATLVIFLFAYLNLNRWHSNFSYFAVVWLLGLIALFGVAVVDPPVASGIARMSFAATAVAGIALIIALSIRGFDRSIMLVPTWALILVWTIGGWMVVTGQLDNDIVQPALTGGLILIVLLIGFTVMQHAFAGGALQQGLFSDIERQALAILGSGDTVWDWDVPRDRVTTRPDVAALLGPSANALGGAARNWLPFLHPEDRDRFRMSLDTLLEHRRGRIAQSFRLRGDDGHYRWFQLRARPVIGSDGEIIRCVGTLADVTEQKKSEERLLHDAVHDNLTGLPNRELFIERLNSVLSLAPISPTIRPSVFVVNLDRFSHVNDGLGISAGDTILLSVARRLHRLLGPQDAMSRLSGDQFCLMVLATDDPAHIAAMADAIRTAIRAPITFAKREIVLTASIGLVAWNQNIIGGEDLIKDAELAMFQAKRLGGDRIEPFRPAFRNVSSGRIQLESDLHRAIEREEIKLVYQPIIALADGSVAGFEALMRWVHPRKGLIGPSEFIPVAERSGLIAQLGLFAMREAATTLAGWMQSPDAPRAFVSVNISSRQLLREDLVADVRSCLQRANLAPELFKLELTETMVMANPEQAAHVLSRLRALGIGLSLDDFGTGYSSLAYLARFAFDTLKIDRTFTSGNTEQTRTLLRSIVTLANDLGLKTVAEGVENDETARQLSELNCTYVQSFAFGEPMDADAALRLLKQQPQARKAS